MKALLFILLSFSLSLNLFSQDPILDSAKSQYDQARYQDCIASYEKFLSQGLNSGEIYYNLGNSYFRVGNIGRAILNYEKALIELPGDEDILHNIEIANSQKKDVFENIPTVGMQSILNSINSYLTFDFWAILSILLFTATTTLYFIGRKRKNKSFSKISIFSVSIAIIFGLISIQQKSAVLNNQSGIVIQNQSNIFSEPNINSTLLLEVNSGSKLKILNEVENWIQIQTPSNEKGWIQTGKIESI